MRHAVWGVCTLIAACTLSACAGCDSAGTSALDDEDAGEGFDASPDGATDPLPNERDCTGVVCGTGQRCELVGDTPSCVGTCEGVECAAGLRCELQGGAGRCVLVCEPVCGIGQTCELDATQTPLCADKTCADLTCEPTEVCAPAPDGLGVVCADNSCESDVDCSEGQQHCEDGICVADVCEPGARRCEGGSVLECTSNGADEFERVACTMQPGLESACEVGAGGAACSCRDDWDCPAYTECVQGRCEGTGREPTCFLPPFSFEQLLPEPEPGFPWGGDDSDGYVNPAVYESPFQHGTPRSRDAAGHPFPRHAQVSATPVVANLDDDNGDGLVDERDLPEVVFTSFCDQNYFNHGVLRAVHAGGPNAGRDYFAVCEGEVWNEGETIADDAGVPVAEADCDCNDGDVEPTGAVAVGDLDREDGLPEIVVVGHSETASTSESGTTQIRIHRNNGEPISSFTVGASFGSNPAVTLANVDGAGFAELVVGPNVFSLERDEQGDLVVAHVLHGNKAKGTNGGQGPVSCVADVQGDARMEIIAGGTVYTVPRAPNEPCPGDTSGLDPEAKAYCAGALQVLWEAPGVEGFCAVADVLGALPEGGAAEVAPGPANPLDGKPEVVLISSGSLRIHDAATGVARLNVVLDTTRSASGSIKADSQVRDGGPPNIDDFDGDGFPEIGTAFDSHYVVHDLQAPSAACPAWPSVLDGEPNSTGAVAGNDPRTPPALGCITDAQCGDPQFVCGKQGTCVCLHNGWHSQTQDESSRVTGSSVFDFNGDGAAEVVYNDECYFRIYDGSTGRIYRRIDSQSPTRIEYPVVADVDSDGNAEIVFSGSNARTELCDRDEPTRPLLNGINVIGDPTDRWVAARRMWNQHAYHVTNIQEEGAIPLHEVPSWTSYGGRSYNTYRSNLPPIGNVAPDLRIVGLQVSSPDVQCGEALSPDLRIVALVTNQGDLRVGPEVIVRFSDQSGAELGNAALGVPLEPGAETFVTLDFHAASSAAMPSEVHAHVDPDQLARECIENNNTAVASVSPEPPMPELRIELSELNDGCPKRLLRAVVHNDSALAVASVGVTLYAGNPAAGAAALQSVTVGPVPANGSAQADVEVDVADRNVSVYAVVDPERAIAECNDGDNAASWDVDCSLLLY